MYVLNDQTEPKKLIKKFRRKQKKNANMQPQQNR